MMGFLSWWGVVDTLPADHWTFLGGLATQVTLVLSDDCFDEEAGGFSLIIR